MQDDDLIFDLKKIFKQLIASGRIDDLLDEDGDIIPSESALKKIEKQHQYEPLNAEEAANRWRLAQAQTLIDWYEKYRTELN